MVSSKIYYLKSDTGKIWCYGYHNGVNWRVFNTDPQTNCWFDWALADPLLSGIFSEKDYIKVNNFKEKTKC